MPIPMWRRALSLFLSMVLVLQNLTCWMTPAWAEELALPNAAIVAEQADSADTAGQPEAGEAQDAVDAPAPVPSDEIAPDAAGDVEAAGDADSADGAADTQQEPQAPIDACVQEGEQGLASEEDAVAPRGEYNPSAPYVTISDSTAYGMELDITYDGETPWLGMAITPDTEMQGEIKGGINEGVLSLHSPRLSYVFPSNIMVPNVAETDLYDESGAYKATWSISNGVFYITYAEEWLQGHPSGITLSINFKMKLNPDAALDADKVEVKFPGVSTVVTFPIKDGNVTGNKWGTVDAESKTVTWNVQLDVASKATNVVLTDTIGSNLTFDGATFKLDGNALATAPVVNGQTATVNLGNLSQGSHTLTYTTPISPDAWKTVANGGQLSGVDNAASWTWGSKGENTNNVGPTGPQLAINMAGKKGTGTSDDITWTASINTGSLKADMAGYVFTDTLGSGHTYKGSYEVKDASGATVATGALPTDGSSFSYTFGADAGKQAYTIVYHTQMTDTASKDPVSNKFTIESPNGSGPSGEAYSDFIPTDDTQYITKKLVSSETAAVDGYATWESTIFTSRMSGNTDPTKVTFSDEFNASQYQRTMFDQLKLTAGDYQLVEGVDYKVTNDGQWNRLEFTFMASDAVRALIGSTDVTVSYRTKCDGSNDTYTNKSTLRTPTVTQSAEASFTIKADKVPEVSKNGNMYWDASFDWSKIEAGSTEKGAWVSNWTVLVNQVQPNGWATVPAGPLGGADVVVTDEMPENMVYVPGTSRYYLHGSDNSTIGHWPALTAEPVCEGSTAVFTVKTDVEGVKADVNYYVELQYQTAVHSSALGNTGSAVQFTNKAYAQAGTQTFPAGFKTVEGTNEIMKKSAEQVPNSSYIKYAISVNKSAVDLVPGSDTLTLVDTMDPKCTYLPATFHVYYQGTTTEVPNCLTLTENVTLASGARATRLTVTIPDSCAVDVVYQVQPAGNPGDQVNLTNSAELTGVANSATSHEKMWMVVKPGVTTEGSGYGITITKFDAANAKKVLEGATFELYQVAWDGTETLVDTQTSNANGVVQFGTADKPLLACTLYYFVETQAPAGYQRSTDRTYLMFKGTYSQEKYQEELDKAKALGIAEPSPATSFNITNKKNDTLVVTGEFQLAVSKTVNGEAPKAGETFEFSATAEGDNAADAPALANVTTAEDGSAAFAVAKLSDKDAGRIYTYRIHEATAAGEGWTNAPDVIATVTVGMPTDSGVLTADVSYRPDVAGSEVYVGAAQFDNAYQVKPATTTFAVDKVVNGEKNDNVSEAFTFELKAASADAPMPEGGSTLMVPGTGTAQFGPIVYDEPGVYEYVIHETTDLGMGWINDADVNVTVEVTVDNDTRDLVSKVDYDRAVADGGAAAFNDIHVADGKAVIAVSKTVNGSSTVKPNETFEFALYQADTDGKVTGEQLGRTVSVATGGTATFDELTFNQVGTYVYVVREIGHDGNGWIAHDDVVVTVSVEMDPATNVLVATVNYGPDKSAAEFNDIYEATGSATLSVAKTVNGEAPADGQEFAFELRAVTEGAPMPEADVATTVGSARASFGRIEFGLADAGRTYEYLIHEATPATAGWTMAADVTATVTVGADMGDGTLAPCAVTYSTATQDSQAALFDNAYEQASGEFQLAVSKTVNGAAPKAGETFEFSATSADEGAPAFENVTTGEDGSASFAAAKLSDKDAGKTYTYRIHEATAAAEGWTNAPDVIATVTVGERGGDNSLTADVSYRLDAAGAEPYAGAARFDNAYQAKPARAALTVDKFVNGEKNASVAKHFTFELKAASENAPMPEGSALLSVTGTGSAQFGAITYDVAGTYAYVIREVSEETAGWTNAPEVTVRVVVGEKGGQSTDRRDLEVKSVEYSNGAGANDEAAVFNNVYSASGGAVISVSKAVVGGTEVTADEVFTFDLLDAEGNKLSTAKAKAGETVSFKPIQYTLSDAGKTFNYTVREVGHNGKGWTADSDVSVAVKVTDSLDGTLDASVSYSRGADSAQFTNVYATSAEAVFSVYKTVNGGTEAKPGEKFTFDLYKADESGLAVGTALGTIVTQMGQVSSFDSVRITSEGTYKFVIHETGHNADGWIAASDVVVTVVATDNGDGTLKLETSYSNESHGAAAFDDVYAATGEAAIAVTKTVNGSTETKPGETFTFDLLDAEGNVLSTAEAKVGQTVFFDRIAYTFDDAGKTFAYTVHETGHNGNGWVADSDVTVTVKVSDNGDGTLKADVSYSRGTDAAAFDNTYAATGSATLSVAKTVNGEAPADGQEFAFELRAVTEGAPMPEADVATTVGSARASFGRIEFGLADAGRTYEYLIHEATPATAGWTMAADVTATVTVGADMGDGTLAPCAVTYSTATQDSQAALFDNAYEQASGEFQLAVSKTVNGAAPKAGETFEFSATSADEGAPAFENVTTGEDGSASFAAAKLSDKDAGKTYTYTIHEVTELTEGAGTWTKAADVIATVAVSERSDDNTLTATVSYSDGSATAAKFDNAYEAQKATATVKVDKTVNGVKNAEEHEKFTFTLLDKNNEQVGDEITVNGTSTAEFGELTFDAPGTYEYTVHETTDLGDGWFNAGDVKVTVSVDYAENGRDLVAKVTYDGSSIDAAQFDNIHAAPATADLKVTKTVNGGPLQPHEQFTFTLLDKDGKQLGDEITIKGSDDKSEAVFGQLAFDKVGTYEFTIHETSDLGDGWTNDGDVKATVTVTRDEATKTLKVEVSYDRSDIDGDAAKFDNKHVASGSATIAVVKQVNGAAPAADQKFDFALSANDEASAAKMPTQTAATTVGSAAAAFGSVDFTLADAGKRFSYTIHETTPAGEGWTNAPDVTVTLTVGDDNDGDGKLPVTVGYSRATADGAAALFDNAYKPVMPEKPVVSEKPSVPKTGDESPVEAMALTAAAGATLAATGLFLGLRSRKRNERL